MDTINLLEKRERETERDRKLGGGGSERHYNSGGGVGNNIFGLKVPRHCPLVLLIGVKLEFRINSRFHNFKVIWGGAAFYGLLSST
jgi:hypothetical protein